MTPQQWYALNCSSFGSPFEHFFFENVLKHVVGIEFSALSVQMPFIDDDGRQRYCDFAISEGQEVRIAIEIDGYDKRGTGTGMSHVEFIDWQRRQSALTAQGWHVLRFANKDVCDEPERCKKNIQSLLSKLRAKEQSNRVTEELRSASSSQPTSEPALTHEIQTIHSAAPRKPTPLIKRVFRKLLMPTAATAAMFVGLSFYGTYLQDNSLQASVSTTQSCSDAIAWSEVHHRVGETVKTAGPITRVTYSPEVNGSPTWIEVGTSFPDPDRLTLLIWGNDRSEFEHLLTQDVIQKKACIEGEVSQYRGSVQIQLQNATQLKVF